MSDPRTALAALGTRFYERGWMWATAGNLSARADAESFWITASGCPKGALTVADFVRIRIVDGAVVSDDATGQKPSAETAIHRAIYRERPSTGCCLHVHTVAAVLASEIGSCLRLPAIEMIKALGVWADDPQVVLPVFVNHHEVARIGEEVGAYLRECPQAIPAVVVSRHGTTAWGASLTQATTHLEAIEFLFAVMARQMPAPIERSIGR